MSPSYNPEKCVRVPLDGRLWIPALYLAAVAMLAYDELDGHIGALTRWAFMIALGAIGWLCITLHAHSRRVILEVMSWEHRQLVLPPEERGLSLVDDGR